MKDVPVVALWAATGTVDIGPFGPVDIRFAFDMCFTLDMPCGARRGRYHIEFGEAKYIEIPEGTVITNYKLRVIVAKRPLPPQGKRSVSKKWSFRASAHTGVGIPP